MPNVDVFELPPKTEVPDAAGEENRLVEELGEGVPNRLFCCPAVDVPPDPPPKIEATEELEAPKPDAAVVGVPPKMDPAVAGA